MSRTQERTYWIYRGGENQGPYTKSETREHADPDTLVSLQDHWIRFSEHPDFDREELDSRSSDSTPSQESPSPNPFLDSSGHIDLAATTRYIDNSSPEDLRRDLSTWNADPTDLLAAADYLRQSEHKHHARVLYAYALKAMENDPTLIAADTNRPGAYYMYGSVLMELEQHRNAIEQFVKATTIDPMDAVSWYRMGICQALTDQLEEAAQTFERTLKLEGRDQHQNAKFFATARKKLEIVRAALRKPAVGESPAAS